jgi:hypothetical protein
LVQLNQHFWVCVPKKNTFGFVNSSVCTGKGSPICMYWQPIILYLWPIVFVYGEHCNR